MVITGVGGTGVVTIGAVLAQAAQIDGKGAAMMEMAGLAQKGGAVNIHLRLAARPEDISAVRVSVGEADALIGGDLVVSAGARTLGLTRGGHTGAVVNSHEIVTGDFTQDAGFNLPGDQLRLALEARMRDRLMLFDASELAIATLGDSIYSNVMILGAAWQRGLVPLDAEAIRQAISLNGTAVARNTRAFEIGRWAAVDPEGAARLCRPQALPERSLEDRIAFRAAHLEAYQDAALARRYRAMVDPIADDDLREAVALSYHKLLAAKDEYEVARLLCDTRDKARAAFDGDFDMTFHLAPPVLGGEGADGRPAKRAFSARWMPAFRLLARLKRLGGTWADPFARHPERRMERALLARFEADMGEWLPQVTPANRDAVLALARLPQDIRGFGPVKARAVSEVEKTRETLLWHLRDGAGDADMAAQ